MNWVRVTRLKCLLLSAAILIGGHEAVCAEKKCSPKDARHIEKQVAKVFGEAAQTDSLEALAAQEWESFPQIDLSKITLTDWRPDQAAAEGRALRLQRGVLNGRAIHVKVVGPEIEEAAPWAQYNATQEAKWFSILNRIGEGPKFLGVAKTADGKFAVVTEVVVGVLVKPFVPLPLAYRQEPLRSKLAGQMRAIIEKLTRNGIQVSDLQFIATPDGRVVIIDPSQFKLRIPQVVESTNDRELSEVLKVLYTR